jgi:hypothetical protein
MPHGLSRQQGGPPPWLRGSSIGSMGVLAWIGLAIIVVFVIICIVYGGRGSGGDGGTSGDHWGGMPPGGELMP